MGIKSILGVCLLIPALVSPLAAQQSPYPVQAPGGSPPPYASTSPAAPHHLPPPGYSPGGQEQFQPQFQGAPHSAGFQQSEWPHYPYPQHHNPHYRQMSPRDAISGTIDWFFALPSHVMDRFSNFLDGNVFPQVPATQGAQDQSTPQVVPRTPPPPPAATYSPNQP
ncbi:MAG: hypothetical protein RDU20_20535 [Desulfomonilaceae bacterium]|nr:hypothetical protein [Desulfomonilaceae bacterium]